MSSKGRIYRDDDKRFAGPPLRFDEARYMMSRIVVSNIDDKVNRESLEDKFSRYGRVLGLSMHRGFAYVQYESENAAYSAIKSENDTSFAGNKIDVRLVKDSRKDEKPKFFAIQAGRKRSPQPRRESNALRDNFIRSSFRDRSPVRGEEVYRKDDFNSRSRSFISPRKDTDDRSSNRGGRPNESFQENRDTPKTNDCEIIVFDKAHRVFAEIVEWKLKSIGMQVDILFPKMESPLIDILEDIGNRGSLYAIVISPQNEAHRSLTVNILHHPGNVQEHRNIPMDDAMVLIANDFETYKRRQASFKDSNLPSVSATNSQLAKTHTNEPELTNKQLYTKEEIQHLLRLLAEGKQIKLTDLDQVIQHLQDFREFLSSNAIESDHTPAPIKQTPNVTRFQALSSTPEEQLKKTLLDILGGNTLKGVIGEGVASAAQQQIIPEDNYSNSNIQSMGQPNWNRSFPAVIERSSFNKSMANSGGENMGKVISPNLNLELPNVKKALDSILQGGGNKIFSNVDPSSNTSLLSAGIGSRNNSGGNYGSSASSHQQQQQQQMHQPQFYGGLPSVASSQYMVASHPNMGRRLGEFNPLGGMQYLQQPMEPQQQQANNFNRFY